MILFDRLKRKYPAEDTNTSSILERSTRKRTARDDADYYNNEIEMGARQEAISSFLDDVSASLLQLQSLEAELRSKKNDLYAEFSEHSRERAEFISLAKAYALTREQLSQQLEQGSETQFQLSAVQRELDQVRGDFHYAEAESQQRQAEIIRLGKEVRRVSDELAEALVTAERTNQHVAWLESDNSALRKQIAEFEEKYRNQDVKIQELGQSLALSEADGAALRKHGDAQASEVNRLARTSSELEEALARQQKKTQLLEGQLSNEQSELRRVSQASEAIALSAKAQVETAEMRAETALSRATRLESENTLLLQQLQEAKATDRTAQRDLVDARINAERQEERVRVLEADLLQIRADAQATSNARSVAVERSDQLLATLDKRNAEVQLFTDRNTELQEKVAKLEAEHAAERARSAESLRHLTEANERLQGEYAVAQGALEGARQDRARLADQVQKYVLRQSSQNSLPPELLDLFGKEPSETTSNIRSASSGKSSRRAREDK
jgi:chromosome segregation ATPase